MTTSNASSSIYQYQLAGYWTWSDFGASVVGGGAGGAAAGAVACAFGSPVGVGAGALTGGLAGAVGGGVGYAAVQGWYWATDYFGVVAQTQ